MAVTFASSIPKTHEIESLEFVVGTEKIEMILFYQPVLEGMTTSQFGALPTVEEIKNGLGAVAESLAHARKTRNDYVTNLSAARQEVERVASQRNWIYRVLGSVGLEDRTPRARRIRDRETWLREIDGRLKDLEADILDCNDEYLKTKQMCDEFTVSRTI